MSYTACCKSKANLDAAVYSALDQIAVNDMRGFHRKIVISLYGFLCLIESLVGGHPSKICAHRVAAVLSSTKLDLPLLCCIPGPRAKREEMLKGNSSTGIGSAAVILRSNLWQMESADQPSCSSCNFLKCLFIVSQHAV